LFKKNSAAASALSGADALFYRLAAGFARFFLSEKKQMSENLKIVIF
jgi:hypothetical protein